MIARFADKDGNQGTKVQASAQNPQPSPTPMPSPTPNPGLACGVERWFVKTLADVDASRVNPAAATPVSIRDLNLMGSHCDGGCNREERPIHLTLLKPNDRSPID